MQHLKGLETTKSFYLINIFNSTRYSEENLYPAEIRSKPWGGKRQYVILKGAPRPITTHVR